MKKKNKNRRILYGYRNLRELSERALRNLDGAMDNAHDVAVMRYVLLQFANWFKTDFKKLPLFEIDPFVDNWCNGMVGEIYRYMSDITKKQEGKNKNEI
ncbi:MAG: hypothetical protein [Bacteriophage sp.]|nr:MAG: hypothetical protein [Bacteriophage sp.]